MTKKDPEKDSERPRFYSQFWLDVAMGRREISLPKTNDEGDADLDMPESPTPQRGMYIPTTPMADGHRKVGTPARAPAVPDEEADFEADLDEDDDLAADEDEEMEIPDLLEDEDEDSLPDADIPDMDLTPKNPPTGGSNRSILDADIPDADITPSPPPLLLDTPSRTQPPPTLSTPPEDEEEDLPADEEDGEEEGEEDWNAGRGRKKPKPGRQVKQPTKQPIKRPTKREPRRF